jgi:hypothetical protein
MDSVRPRWRRRTVRPLSLSQVCTGVIGCEPFLTKWALLSGIAQTATSEANARVLPCSPFVTLPDGMCLMER